MLCCQSFLELCPLDWYYFDGKCWRFSPDDQKASWQAAQDICREASSGHGNLMSVHGNWDSSILMDAFSDDPWIGLTILGENNYQWVDGSPVNYLGWKEGGKSTS